ncbi:Polyketide cyclase / dehydrase and lipid transport [Marininema mesophilum]|uniref:Polyketide cyclase / dehydrase and lipid transport n=1 Tax=Marininema mesophilum TaxID=1048340 RepID=A0A1H2Z4C0_9BACL|nr:SRPBCC family protein [Marininema mesophilum]SDX12206.1 Polyketide cyclase / dehydrase and lipid transport [Marininema mesophilum]
MANTVATIEIPTSPDQVWKVIGGFNSLPDWLPQIIRSSELGEGGRVRRLENIDGDVVVERLETFNEKERYYTYSIDQAPFPATHYEATLRVRENGGKGSLVEWSGKFTPVGVSDDEVINLFHGIYTDGLDALKKVFQA